MSRHASIFESSLFPSTFGVPSYSDSFSYGPNSSSPFAVSDMSAYDTEYNAAAAAAFKLYEPPVSHYPGPGRAYSNAKGGAAPALLQIPTMVDPKDSLYGNYSGHRAMDKAPRMPLPVGSNAPVTAMPKAASAAAVVSQSGLVNCSRVRPDKIEFSLSFRRHLDQVSHDPRRNNKVTLQKIYEEWVATMTTPPVLTYSESLFAMYLCGVIKVHKNGDVTYKSLNTSAEIVANNFAKVVPQDQHIELTNVLCRAIERLRTTRQQPTLANIRQQITDFLGTKKLSDTDWRNLTNVLNWSDDFRNQQATIDGASAQVYFVTAPSEAAPLAAKPPPAQPLAPPAPVAIIPIPIPVPVPVAHPNGAIAGPSCSEIALIAAVRQYIQHSPEGTHLGITAALQPTEPRRRDEWLAAKASLLLKIAPAPICAIPHHSLVHYLQLILQDPIDPISVSTSTSVSASASASASAAALTVSWFNETNGPLPPTVSYQFLESLSDEDDTSYGSVEITGAHSSQEDGRRGLTPQSPYPHRVPSLFDSPIAFGSARPRPAHVQPFAAVSPGMSAMNPPLLHAPIASDPDAAFLASPTNSLFSAPPNTAVANPISSLFSLPSIFGQKF